MNKNRENCRYGYWCRLQNVLIREVFIKGWRSSMVSPFRAIRRYVSTARLRRWMAAGIIRRPPWVGIGGPGVRKRERTGEPMRVLLVQEAAGIHLHDVCSSPSPGARRARSPAILAPKEEGQVDAEADNRLLSSRCAGRSRAAGSFCVSANVVNGSVDDDRAYHLHRDSCQGVNRRLVPGAKTTTQLRGQVTRHADQQRRQPRPVSQGSVRRAHREAHRSALPPTTASRLEHRVRQTRWWD